MAVKKLSGNVKIWRSGPPRTRVHKSCRHEPLRGAVFARGLQPFKENYLSFCATVVGARVELGDAIAPPAIEPLFHVAQLDRTGLSSLG